MNLKNGREGFFVETSEKMRIARTLNALSKYVKYILESKTGKIELRKRTLLTAVPLKINLGDIGKIKLPFPSLSEQQRIVSILDTFEASIQNLEAQLSQREKQYEYYRNKLLTFD